MKFFSFFLFLKIIVGLWLGLYFSVLSLKKNDQLTPLIEAPLKTFFKDNYFTHLSLSNVDVSLFPLSIKLNTIFLCPLNESPQATWSLHAKDISLSISFFSLLFHRHCSIIATCDECALSTTFDDYSNVFQKQKDAFFKKQITPYRHTPQHKKISFSLDSLTIRNGKLFFYNPKTTMSGTLFYEALLIRNDNTFYGSTTIKDGFLEKKGIQLLHSIQGTINGHYQPEQQHPFLFSTASSSLSITTTFPYCATEKIHVQSEWKNQQGALKYISSHNDFNGELLFHYTKDNELYYTLTTKAPFPFFCALLDIKETPSIRGIIECKSKGTFNAYEATLSLIKPSWRVHECDSLLCFMYKKNNLTTATLHINHKAVSLAGTYEYNHQTNQAHGSLTNTTAWKLSDKGWVISPAQLCINYTAHADETAMCTHALSLFNQQQDLTINTKGNVSYEKNNSIHGEGICNALHYTIESDLSNTQKPFSFIINHKNNQRFLTITTDNKNSSFKINLAFEAIRRIILYLYDYHITGQGNLIAEGTVNHESFDAKVFSENLLIKLPETYNFIHHITWNMTGTLFPLSFKATDLMLSLHKGHITSNALQYALDNTFALRILHIPLHMRKCFINWQDRFLGNISGACVIQKKGTSPYSIEGFLIAEDGIIKENPLALATQKQTMPEALSLPLKTHFSIMTKKPISIKTPQLHSCATGQGHFIFDGKNSIATGNLQLLGGSIQFPYKPLSITRADIVFQEKQSDNPAIDIILQGLLKKYSVTLSVTGHIQDPHITLQSIPTLNDEQIIELLLTGSVGESLSSMVPSILMHNIESIIFGATQQSKSTIATLMQPFKRVHFIPSFTDQSEKGGIRGAIDIEISDYFHALFQKNFNTEYTRIECEYIVGDDISLRAIKDERDDIGGEIEMRFSL